MTETYSSAVQTARSYYNSTDADSFYAVIWGGEDIHVGIYLTSSEDIGTASRRTVEQMADQLVLDGDGRVLDLGAGFGGAARYLTGRFGCSVTCLNLSEIENTRNRELNAAAGVTDRIDVVDGSFDVLPFEANSFDVIWSQDAFLHSDDRSRVLAEAIRVLRPGGTIVFTDPMASDNARPEALEPILQRINLTSMATPGFYRSELERLGLQGVTFTERTEHLSQHYARVHEESERRASELDGRVSAEYLERMRAGLRHWVDGGRRGDLAWGIFRADLPA